MNVVKTIRDVRNLVSRARSRGATIGLVPTMGALHAGHVSLIRRCVNDGRFTVVSIFVNPTQFGPKEDLANYPRPLRADLETCRRAGVDVVFVPGAKQMYRTGNLTWVNVEKLGDPLCGRFRPGHFRGVATVCAKLFNIVQPDVAYFGQKDVQQAVIIKQMLADLNFPLKIIVCPTVRAADGLALSSRNQYLSPKQKKDATCLYRSLTTARKLIMAGVTNPKTITAQIRRILRSADSLTAIDYVSIVDAETLQNVARVSARVLIAVAVRFGPTRLIDNLLVDAPKR